MINDFNVERNTNEIHEEFKFLLKVLVIVGIPSVLTFIEPDTGAVLIYFIITWKHFYVRALFSCLIYSILFKYIIYVYTIHSPYY